MGVTSLGIYTLELSEKEPEALFEKVRALGFSAVQFSLCSCGCAEEVPEAVPSDACLDAYRRAAEARGIAFAAVNGTWNMAHPDPRARAEGARRMDAVCRAAARLGCGLVSLCTGTRCRESMWVPHPDNGTEAAWRDLCGSMAPALESAERWGVRLGLEPEASNVCNTPQKVRRLMDEMGSDRLGVIMDGANLFRAGMARRADVRAVLDEAFRLLGRSVLLAHAKDIREGDGICFTYAGDGIVDFPYFYRLLAQAGYGGPMIVHGTKNEEEARRAAAYLAAMPERA